MCFRMLTLRNSLLILMLALSVVASAQTVGSTLYTFSEQTSFWPQGSLLEDGTGNLYGTTRGGGAYGVGSVIELSPPAVSGGAWTLATLYSFVPYGVSGYVPISDLVKDQAGAFYGTTFVGGDSVCNCGGVYKLVPPTVTGGAWTESVIYNFKGGADGRLPAVAALALTSNGTLYGVTIRGGTWDNGVLYQLTTKNGKAYTEKVLYSFGEAGDASTPNGPVTVDANGYIYGTAAQGGAFGQGSVYRYVPATKTHVANESLLYSFGGSSTTGATPIGNLIFDSGGNLYGVTYEGGSGGDGVVYSLAPSPTTWTESVLFTFSKNSGTNPVAGLSWNHTNNNLYGTASSGNPNTSGDGTVFKMTPPAVKGGAWTESTLYQFTYKVVGGYPTGVVTRDSKTGTLYGTAINGGIEGCDLYCGTIWSITNP